MTLDSLFRWTYSVEMDGHRRIDWVRLLCTCAVLAFCLRTFTDNKADVDLWGNVGFVTSPPWSSEFHTTNTFSFTQPDYPWVNHEWLGEYILYRVHAAGGTAGLLGLKLFLGLCVVWLLVRSLQDSCHSGAIRLLFLLLIISTIGYGFSTRPHHFTYLLLAVFLRLLTRHPGNRIVMWGIVPALGILWANLHGAFFIGAILLLVVTILEAVEVFRDGHTDRSRTGFLLPLASCGLFFVCSGINPYGFRLWRYIFESAQIVRPYLSEWAPFHPLRDFASHTDFIALTLISGAAIVFARSRRSVTWVGVLALAWVAALLMRRNIPLFAIAAAFVVPRHLDEIAGPALDRWMARVSRPLLSAVLALFVLLSTGYAFWFDKKNPFEIEIPSDRFPIETMAFMRAHQVSGNLLVFFDWAEYCIWELYPNCRVFMDGRFCSAYSPDRIREYLDFIYARDRWAVALTHYPTDWVLIHRGNPVYNLMLVIPGWTLVHETRLAGLFARNDAHGALIEKMRRGEMRQPPPDPDGYFH